MIRNIVSNTAVIAVSLTRAVTSRSVEDKVQVEDEPEPSSLTCLPGSAGGHVDIKSGASVSATPIVLFFQSCR
jgi:hypothetical protein